MLEKMPKVTSHGIYVTFKMAEVAVPRQMFVNFPWLIARLRVARNRMTARWKQMREAMRSEVCPNAG